MWLSILVVGSSMAQQVAGQTQGSLPGSLDARTIVSVMAVVLTLVMMLYTMFRNRRSDLAQDLEQAKKQLREELSTAKQTLDDFSKQSHGRISKQVADCDRRFEKMEVRDGSMGTRINDLEKTASRCEGADISRRVTDLEKTVASQGLSVERIGTEVEGARTSLAGVIAKIDRL